MSETWVGWALHSIPKKIKGDSTGRIRTAREKRLKAETWVLNRIKEDAPKLLDGNPNSPPEQEFIDNLLKTIDRSKGKIKKWRRNYLLRGLNRGTRELGWPAFPHMPIVGLHLRGSPINAVTFPTIKRFRHLRTEFLQYLNTARAALPAKAEAPSPEQLSDDQELLRQGEVLLSCILFGALASRQRIEAIATYGLQRIGVWDDMMWIDWNDSPDVASESWQRWLPDPVSALLIAQARADGMDQLLPRIEGRKPLVAIWMALDSILAKLPLDPDDKPTSLTMLLGWANAWLFRYLHPFLADYAAGDLPSASLPPHAWRRLFERRPIPREGAAETNATDLSSNQLTRYNRSPILPADLETSALSLRKILRGELGDKSRPAKVTRSAHKIHHALFTFRQNGNLPPVVQLLTDWTYQRLKRDVADHATVSVVLQQLEAFDRLLMDAVGLDDLLNYDVERLRAVYESIIDASGSGKRHNLRAAALGSFHQFLQRQFGAADPGSDLFEDVPVHGGVDANCFGEDDILAILELLGPLNSVSSQRQAQAQQVAFLFSARCTLRRGEILHFRLSDLQGETAPCLIRRQRKDEPLKSSNSVRVIPLVALLSEDELKLVRAYRDMLVESIKDAESKNGITIDRDNVMLFPRDSDLMRPLLETTLFNPINRAIHAVTQDKTLRVQHGRHSSIAHIAMTLLENVLPGCSVPIAEPQSPGDLEIVLPGCSDPITETQSPGKARTLQAQLIGTTDPNRQHLWAVAAVAGHSSPEITLGNYFHLCDWLLRCSLEACQPDLLQPALTSIVSGMTTTEVGSTLHRLGVKPDAAFVLALHNVKEFADMWPSSAKMPSPGAPHHDAIVVGAVPKATAEYSSASLISLRGHPLNAVQILNLLDDLDTLLGSRKPAGAKSKKSTAPAGTTVESIARQHDVEAGSAHSLWEIVKALSKITGGRLRGKKNVGESDEAPARVSLSLYGRLLSRPLPRARPTRSAEEQRRTNAAFQALQQAWLADGNKVVDWLALHWKHGIADTNAVGFGDPVPAKSWLAFWKELVCMSNAGLEVENLKFLHRGNGRQGAKPVEAQRLHWSKELSIPLSSVAAGTPYQKPKGQTGYGFVEITLNYDVPLTKSWATQKLHRNVSKSRGKSSSVALDTAAYVMTALLALEGLKGGSLIPRGLETNSAPHG